jgi:hypothetical protein
MLHIQPGQIHPGKLSPPPKNSILKPGSSAALRSQMFSALIRKDLLEDSHEKASNHRNNVHWQHDALRCPFVSAFLASDCRFGHAGYGGCTGRAAGDARQRRRCGAQICTALRRWRYLLISGTA